MYFVTRVKYLRNGEVKKSELMSYDILNEALAKFHTNLGTDMMDDTLKGSMCTVTNSHGGQECKEYWGYTDIDEEPTPEPDEDPEENIE